MVKDGRALLFAHVPKTGGSTIERHFRKAGWRLHFRSTSKSEPTFFAFRRCSPQHFHAEILEQLVDVPRMADSFVVVRDPIARFRSEFAMRHSGWEHAPGDAVQSWAENMFGCYERDPFVLDNHLRPQVEFVLPGARVFRLEDGLETLVADLNKRLGLDLPTELARRLDSTERGLPSSAVEISDGTRALVEQWYDDDYRRFGYDR